MADTPLLAIVAPVRDVTGAGKAVLAVGGPEGRLLVPVALCQ